MQEFLLKYDVYFHPITECGVGMGEKAGKAVARASAINLLKHSLREHSTFSLSPCQASRCT